MSLNLDLAWIEAVMLASVRIIAFLVIAPPFSYKAFPIRVKAMLGVGLAFAVSPRVTDSYTSLDTLTFFGTLIVQLLIGLILGFLVYLVFAAVQSAGSLIDLFGGFQLAQAYDPQMMTNGAQFTRLLQVVALALLFASNGYQLILGGIVRTFTAVPLGSNIDLGLSAEALVSGTSQMFLASVQIAGPLIVVLFLADIGLGLLTRVAPAINAFALGLPLKVLITLMVGGVIFVALPQIVASLTGDALNFMSGVS